MLVSAPLQVTSRTCAMSNASLLPVRCAWAWRAVVLLRLLACLALPGAEPGAVRHWVSSLGCVLLRKRHLPFQLSMPKWASGETIH